MDESVRATLGAAAFALNEIRDGDKIPRSAGEIDAFVALFRKDVTNIVRNTIPGGDVNVDALNFASAVLRTMLRAR